MLSHTCSTHLVCLNCNLWHNLVKILKMILQLLLRCSKIQIFFLIFLYSLLQGADFLLLSCSKLRIFLLQKLLQNQFNLSHPCVWYSEQGPI
ncbi:unnamed protein product [Ixodes persulcatus]